MGLSDINDIGWGKDGEGRGRVYTFLRGHRKVKYIEALVGVGGRVYRLWGGPQESEGLEGFS